MYNFLTCMLSDACNDVYSVHSKTSNCVFLQFVADITKQLFKMCYSTKLKKTLTVVPATAGPLDEPTPALVGHFCNVLVNYFAALMSLYPTATCLNRPADSQMLDPVPARETVT